MFENIKVKEKIGDKYYFENNGKFSGCSTKEIIDRVLVRSFGKNKMMFYRKKAVDEYEEDQKQEMDKIKKDLEDKVKKEGGISNTTFRGPISSSVFGNIHNSDFGNEIKNSVVFNLDKVTFLSRIKNSILGIDFNKNTKKSSKLWNIIFNPYYSLLIFAFVVYIILKVFNVNLINYMP